MNDSKQYHVPVLVEEVCRQLITDRNGVYLDGTLGGGGHAEEILKRLTPQARYIGIDRDPQAIEFARKRLASFKNVTFYHGVFDEVQQAMEAAGVNVVNGVLLDLGISGHQVDAAERGFTFRAETVLDMRMDPWRTTVTAAKILNSYDERRLWKIFKEYGEEAQARKIARLIVRERQAKPIETSGQLVKIIDRCVPQRHAKKSYARIFQALRIEVNRELEILQNALEQIVKALKSGGRLVVISYHSLEDRIVKNFLRKMENPCECPPELPVCVCGKKPVMKRIRPYLITPSEEEVAKNPRARSAKMRIGEKI